MQRRDFLVIAALGVSGGFVGPSRAQTHGIVDAVRSQLSVADDYLQAKLTFDAIIRPSIDNVSASRAIDRLTLSRRESIATMAHTVGEFLLEAGRYEDVIDVAEAINEHAPRDIGSILLGGAAYGRMFTQEFESRYPTPESIPPNLRPRYRELATMNASLYAHAESLGWRPSE